MLLIRPSPIAYESARGYVLRIAELNGLKGPRWLLSYLESRNIICDGYDALEYLLARDMSSHTLRGPIANMGKLNAPDHAGLPMRYWNTHNPRFCPLCLAASAHWKAEWDIVFTVACPRHQTRLVDRCPSCKSFLSWYRSSILVCECGAHLTKMPTEEASNASIKVAREIAGRLEHKAWYSVPLAFPTFHLALEPYLRLIWFFGGYGRDAKGKPQKMAGLQCVDVAEAAVSAAVDALDGWPEGFYRLLRKVTDRYKSRAMNHRLASRFGHFYFTIYKEFKSEELVFVRQAFEKYVQGTWVGQLNARNKRLCDTLKTDYDWMPVSQAAKLMGIRASSVKSLIESGSLKGELRKTAKERLMGMVRKSSIRHFLQEKEECLTLSQARELLGISRKCAEVLIKDGSLVPRNPERNPGTPWVFLRSQILQNKNLKQFFENAQRAGNLNTTHGAS